jgi:NCS1 family nucleobase:cation symporter-1
LIADYFVIRRTRLQLPGLYQQRGPYWYLWGINPAALVALVAGIAPCVPGFVGTVSKKFQVPPFWMDLYSYAWFISFAIAFVVYLVLMQISGKARSAAA